MVRSPQLPLDRTLIRTVLEVAGLIALVLAWRKVAVQRRMIRRLIDAQIEQADERLEASLEAVRRG